MKRHPLYSRTGRSRVPVGESPTPAGAAQPEKRLPGPRVKRRPLLAAALGLLAAALIGAQIALAPAKPELTQEAIDEAVLRTLQQATLPSPAAKAYERVRPSVVRVRAEGEAVESDDGQRATGSGVVIVDRGLILTNLHVVESARRISVVFANGHQSEARLVSTQPENDLAVIQALELPDDLVPATLGAAADLADGDLVVAVGFPFGIGPSVSSGVVSGQRREYRSPHGNRTLSNLIQFDAAANPGSSGGPLVNAAGEVVGIVTAILSPSERGAFAGIAFAVPIETASSAAGLPPF